SLPRFTQQNIAANKSVVDAIEQLADSKQCTPAQIALGWLLAKGNDIVPIPGTKRVKYLEQNVDSTNIELAANELAALDERTSAIAIAGERYTEEGMKGVNA
nr:aldo/keto reductase [Gammaproteobacteria bacterium]